MLDSLFKVPVESKSKQRVCTKSHLRIHTTKASDETYSRKRDRTEIERARRAFYVDEEIQ